MNSGEQYMNRTVKIENGYELVVTKLTDRAQQPETVIKNSDFRKTARM
jgi:nitrogen fixation protein